MTIATVEERVGQTEEFDPFKYFPGGREGVLERFGREVKRIAERFSPQQAQSYCEYWDIDIQTFYAIAKGNYHLINSDIAQKVQSVRFTFNDGFGRPNVSHEERDTIANMAKGFVVGTGSGDDYDPSDGIELFLISQALQKLAA